MTLIKALRVTALRMLRRTLSVPIFVKILGIGAVVAILFGLVTLLWTHGSMTRVIYNLQENRTISIAHSLADNLEGPVSTLDVVHIREMISKAVERFSDIRYIIIWDSSNKVIAHTFPSEIPLDLLSLPREKASSESELRVLSRGKNVVFDYLCPLLSGHGGLLQIGTRDQILAEELATVRQSIIWSLFLSVLIGSDSLKDSTGGNFQHLASLGGEPCQRSSDLSHR